MKVPRLNKLLAFKVNISIKIKIILETRSSKQIKASEQFSTLEKSQAKSSFIKGNQKKNECNLKSNECNLVEEKLIMQNRS